VAQRTAGDIATGSPGSTTNEMLWGEFAGTNPAMRTLNAPADNAETWRNLRLDFTHQPLVGSLQNDECNRRS
jgi:hypothetical protein